MNKSAIKNFAIWARNKLIADIGYKAGLLGITDKEIKPPLPQSTKDAQFFDIGSREPYQITGAAIAQRKALADKISERAKQNDYATAYKAVIEEVAYTWFNRLIAVRFMEVNDYLPSRIRVLSSEPIRDEQGNLVKSGKTEPDIITTPFDTDLHFTQTEREYIIACKTDNKLDELFSMLFIKQCNALNRIFPELFEKTNDYTELLLNISYTDREGVIWHLVNDIAESDFKEEQIIGWMYQYYNEQRRNEVINIYKGTVKKEDIPPATQLYTTEWVVKYMVDNSLGRYWLERNPQSKLREKLEFFVTPESDMVYVNENINPADLTFLDPCMGSGHILVYAFDVLMEIYRECGYADSNAVVSILQNNLFGLDIDDRAYQLAYFAVMMKARSYSRRILTMEVSPHVLAIQESNGITKFTHDGITNNKAMNTIGEYLIERFRHAKEIGSIQTVEEKDYFAFFVYMEECEKAGPYDIEGSAWVQQVKPLMQKLAEQAELMSKKYAVVATNPPYLNKIESHLKDFVVCEYKPYSGDLFSVFMYRNFGFCKPSGYSAFMSPFVWMFIKTYENLREYIISYKSITALVQMEYSAFEEATVPICSFVLKNAKETQPGVYFKLSEFKGGMEVQCQRVLEAITNPECSYRYTASTDNFAKIPGSPVAYWVSEKMKNAFLSKESIASVAPPKQGLATADNDRFLRLWYEVALHNIGFGIGSCEEALSSQRKWFPYNKGGAFRRWYGNREYIVNWSNDGYEIKNFRDSDGKVRSRPQNLSFYFRIAITWSDVTSASFSGRYCDKGFMFDIKGSSGFPPVEILKYVLGFLNSHVSQNIIKILNPTITTQVGDMSRIPILRDHEKKERVDALVDDSIEISCVDWDSFETSWDFSRHPLVVWQEYGAAHHPDEYGNTICEAYMSWMAQTTRQFETLRKNEEELNRIFIDIYGLQDELTPEVADKDVTVARIYDRKEDIPESMKGNGYVLTRADVIKSFISYAVGCMFGRYSLDVEGLVLAGENLLEKFTLYGTLEEESKKKPNGNLVVDFDKVYGLRGMDKASFQPDRDNIIPITDEEYLPDDIVTRFVEFVRTVYGSSTLEENLRFIADALGGKGSTARELIRNYFLRDFYKDHVKTYQKRPIYWLFDSGKADGFKALIYLHRYDQDTVGKLRVDYLHKLQRVYESEIARMRDTIEKSGDAREVSAAQKRLEKLIKQLKEAKEYDEKIAHLALARIALDLDDGVKVNYEKLQTGSNGKRYEVLGKII